MKPGHFTAAKRQKQPDIPGRQNRLLLWLKRNLCASPLQIALTIIALLLILYSIVPFIRWALIDAVWQGENRHACTTLLQGGLRADNWSGACWAFVRANFSQFIYGFYPVAERWRVIATFALALLTAVPLLTPAVPHKFINAGIALILVPLIGGVLLVGGVFGLPFVDTSLWGGLMVTLIIAYCSIILSLPLGIMLALGRRCKMAALRLFCVAFIELLRGIPLVALLFIASVLFPLFLPQGMNFDKFLRALIAVALFTSVYIAETIRGGLQAVPKSQYEAAASLGFTYPFAMAFILLPQAVRLVIPALVNVLIGMFKETSLVYIISMYDLLGIVRSASMQANWITPQTPATGLIFAGLVFWFFCFALSLYARFLENYSKRERAA
ncbi:amino acid ABC transporter permease [Candidatus Tokpelaia sp.]|uniref:amino acid ABC transporter permease n=1 Tax=Candidatus Tokpelaia sp. TaxID=2233777 RepID=UPI00123BD0A6|nr:amino acid ABC transporter permease [Candidatus Tokpelaia sp.]KAA6404749.1 amino acid ABC transporter permease [Candidatus Tokpelaia sp.]